MHINTYLNIGTIKVYSYNNYLFSFEKLVQQFKSFVLSLKYTYLLHRRILGRSSIIPDTVLGSSDISNCSNHGHSNTVNRAHNTQCKKTIYLSANVKSASVLHHINCKKT